MWGNYIHSFAKMLKEGSGIVYIIYKTCIVYDLCPIFTGS